jgi:hypothetical protein
MSRVIATAEGETVTCDLLSDGSVALRPTPLDAQIRMQARWALSAPWRRVGIEADGRT